MFRGRPKDSGVRDNSEREMVPGQHLYCPSLLFYPKVAKEKRPPKTGRKNIDTSCGLEGANPTADKDAEYDPLPASTILKGGKKKRSNHRPSAAKNLHFSDYMIVTTGRAQTGTSARNRGKTVTKALKGKPEIKKASMVEGNAQLRLGADRFRRCDRARIQGPKYANFYNLGTIVGRRKSGGRRRRSRVF